MVLAGGEEEEGKVRLRLQEKRGSRGKTHDRSDRSRVDSPRRVNRLSCLKLGSVQSSMS